MKKKLLLFVTILLVAAFALTLAACNRKGDEKERENICRRTDSYLAGESENFAVTLESGIREKLFIADGKATDVVRFTELVVTPLKKNDYAELTYTLTDGESSLSGSVDAPVNGSYVVPVTLDFVPTTALIEAGQDTCEIELNDVLADSLDSGDAINIARDAFADSIDKEKEEGKPEREVYVKLITGDRTTYFYYVSFIGDGVDYWAALIDPKTGEIISKK